ncbi:MAG TPA: hypothetical protein VFQ53_42400 [Kofleriaceae bacterium]|nr:hypothetical protein [Kofleriaceae bacterium]
MRSRVLRIALVALASIGGLAALALVLALEEPALGYAIPWIVAMVVVAAFAWRLPRLALLIGFTGGVAYCCFAFVASLGHIGMGDCGSSCEAASARWNAGHEPFFGTAMLFTLALLVVGIVYGIASLAGRARNDAIAPPSVVR